MSRESHFYNELSDEINSGEHDDHLDFLEFAIKTRRNTLAIAGEEELLASLEEGDLVKLRMDAPIGPKYLLGILLEVKEVHRTRISCDVANPGLLPSQRFASGILVPAKHLEKA